MPFGLGFFLRVRDVTLIKWALKPTAPTPLTCLVCCNKRPALVQRRRRSVRWAGVRQLLLSLGKHWLFVFCRKISPVIQVHTPLGCQTRLHTVHKTARQIDFAVCAPSRCVCVTSGGRSDGRYIINAHFPRRTKTY